MAKYERTITGDEGAILTMLHDHIMAGGWSMSLVEESDVHMGSVHIVTRVYDKYFMRNSSRASLTLVVVSQGDELSITAIGSGAGTSPTVNISVGAEAELVSIVAHAIEDTL